MHISKFLSRGFSAFLFRLLASWCGARVLGRAARLFVAVSSKNGMTKAIRRVFCALILIGVFMCPAIRAGNTNTARAR